MFKLTVQILTFSLTLSMLAAAQAQQAPPEGQPQQARPAETYHESALRRFEIITLSSLPFTAVQSYLVVRGVKMYRENQIAPELSPRDYRIIGIGAASLSLFIGVWDWWRTRDVDISAPRIPEPEPPPPPPPPPPEEGAPEEGEPIEGEPIEGPVARLPHNVPITVARGTPIPFVPSGNRLNRWANEPAAGIAVPILLIRF